MLRALDGLLERVGAARGKPRAGEAEADARLSSLLALSSHWYWEQDEHLRYVELSGLVAADQGRMHAATYLGKTRWEWAGASLEDPRWAQHAGQLARRETFRDFEFRRPDGRWVSVSGEPMFDAGGRFAGYRGVACDVTRRRQDQERVLRIARMYAALSALNEMMPRMPGADALLQRACNIAAASGDFVRATVRVRVPGSAWTRVAAASGVQNDMVSAHRASADDALPEGRSVAGEVLRSGRVLIITDPHQHPLLARLRGSPLLAGARSVGAFPIRQGDAVFGVLILHGAERHSFDGEMQELLVHMAESISFGLEHFDARLRQQQTFELAGVGIAHVRLDSGLERVNPRFCELLGYPAEAMVGLSMKELSHPEDRDATDAARASLRTGEARSVRVEKRYLNGRGSVLWAAVTIALARDAEGRPAYEICFLEDITARKLAEAERERVRRMYASLGAVSELAASARSEQELLQSACEIAVSSGDFQFALVRMADAAGRHAEMTALAGREQVPWLKRPLMLDPASSDGQSLSVRAFRTGRSCVLTGEALTGRSMFSRLTEATGTRSAGAYPLYRDGACVGSLLLNSRDAQAFEGETGELLERMARMVSRALDALATHDVLLRFRTALDASADLIVLIDPAALRFVDVNETMCRRVGYSRQELVGMPLERLLPNSREELARAYDELIAEPARTDVFRSEYLCKDGTRLPFESKRRVLRSGDRWLIVGVIRELRGRAADSPSGSA